MQRIEQRLQRLEREMNTHQAAIEITDEVRAQSALELAAWRAEQQAAIDAWDAQMLAASVGPGHVGLTACPPCPR
jgi:hypothetical protein